MNHSYHLTSTVDGQQVVSYFGGSTPLVATSGHPNFKGIVDALVNGEDVNVEELFDIGRGIVSRFNRLSERVTVKDDELFFDGDPMHSSLASVILESYQDRKDFDPLVNFLEKVETNPNPVSVSQLWNWLANLSFSVCDDGDFLAYKSVDENYLSHSSGTAIVDGVEITGKIPNKVGSIIEMPRNDVNGNSSIACSTGLHAGTYQYASSFYAGSPVILVKINPRDVVSVPNDSSAQKLRVCRYLVVSHDIDEELESYFAANDTVEAYIPADQQITFGVTVSWDDLGGDWDDDADADEWDTYGSWDDDLDDDEDDDLEDEDDEGDDLDDMTRTEIRQIAKNLGIKRRDENGNNRNKSDLIALIRATY